MRLCKVSYSLNIILVLALVTCLLLLKPVNYINKDKSISCSVVEYHSVSSDSYSVTSECDGKEYTTLISKYYSPEYIIGYSYIVQPYDEISYYVRLLDFAENSEKLEVAIEIDGYSPLEVLITKQ